MLDPLDEWLSGERDSTWKADALCREPAYSDVVFFIERGGDDRPARALCARCLVTDECLAYAIEHELGGIWGGTSERQRDALRKAAQAA